MIDLGAILKTYIYLVSASLLYPVLLLLAALTLLVIVYAGAFLAEWLERSRLRRCPPQELPMLLKNGGNDGVVAHRVIDYMATLKKLIDLPATHPVAVENLLQTTTLELWKSMDRLRMLVRVAPSLGLIGTLIPMGTGLAALGQGDMARLSSDLVIAFTTTVTGLAIGTLAFFFYTVRRRWVEEDIKNMELVTELLAPQPERTQDALHAQTAN